MDRAKQRIIDRQKRSFRIRRKISGSPERPRLSVRRSLKHIQAQLVDDVNHTTIAQATSACKEIAEKIAKDKRPTKSEVSRAVGELIAERAKAKGVEKVVFDRKGYAYHVRVKALAEGARARGLVF